MKRFVYAGMVCAGAALCATAISIAVGQPPVAPGGAKVEAVGPRQPGGYFGDLGKYLTIEGGRAEGGKVETGTLLVDTVEGKKLDKPITVLIKSLNYRDRTIWFTDQLPAKQRCVFKGYESGEMVGRSAAERAAAKEQGWTDWNEVQSSTPWQWRPYFVALVVVEPKGLELRKR